MSVRLSERRGDPTRETDGFTLIEMVVALTITATVMLASTFVFFGSLRAFAAARSRSVFVEIANKEMESLRALPYNVTGVASSDVNLGSAYPSGKFEGRDAVTSCTPASPVTSACPSSPSPLAAVEIVSTSPLSNISLPYTIRRWVTWTDPQDGSTHVFKRLTLKVEWNDKNLVAHEFRLYSVLYPGGRGPAAASGPTAAFTATPTSGMVPLTVGFDASSSTGTGLTYAWDFGDAQAGTGVSPSHAYSAPGTYVATLTVNASGGGTSSAGQTITVAAPTASFTATPMTGTAPLAVAFDASASTGTGLTYAWTFGDTQTGTGVSLSHTYSSAGTYTATLTVTATGGATDSTTAAITVAAPGPTAAFTVSSTSGAAPLTVMFNGSGSTGTGLTYAWAFGDSQTATGVSPSHTYSAVGSFTATLTITASGGATNSTSKVITVTAAGPTASFTATTTPGALTVAFNASASAGTGLTFAWDFGDTQTGTGASLSHAYSAGGTYTATLTVKDSGNLTSTATRTFSVTACTITDAWIVNNGLTNRVVVQSSNNNVKTDPVTFKVQTSLYCTSVASSITGLNAPAGAWTKVSSGAGWLWTVNVTGGTGNNAASLTTSCNQSGTATAIPNSATKSFAYAAYHTSNQNPNPCP